MAVRPAVSSSTPGDRDRILPRDHGQGGHAGLLAELAELLLRGGAARVERGHEDLAARLLKPEADLARGGRLARALEADHHHDHGGGGVQVDRLVRLAERGDQLVMDDLDDLLPRLDRLHDGLADRLLLHPVDEGPHDLQRHVGLDQRAAHLAQGRRDVLLRERAAPGQVVEDATEAIR